MSDSITVVWCDDLKDTFNSFMLYKGKCDLMVRDEGEILNQRKRDVAWNSDVTKMCLDAEKTSGEKQVEKLNSFSKPHFVGLFCLSRLFSCGIQSES